MLSCAMLLLFFFFFFWVWISAVTGLDFWISIWTLDYYMISFFFGLAWFFCCAHTNTHTNWFQFRQITKTTITLQKFFDAYFLKNGNRNLKLKMKFNYELKWFHTFRFTYFIFLHCILWTSLMLKLYEIRNFTIVD